MDRDTAFEMAQSTMRFGSGITREVGMDLKDRGLRRVMVLTDRCAIFPQCKRR